MNSIRITPEHLEQLRGTLLSHAPAEAAGFLLAGWFQTGSRLHFVVRELMIPQQKDYDVQGDLQLQVSPIFFNRVISRAEREGLAVIMCHTHPFSDGAWFSPADDYGEAISAKTLHECLEGRPCASLVIDPVSMAARAWRSPSLPPESINEVRVVGRRFARVVLGAASGPSIDLAVFSRQVLALGREGQAVLSGLKVGVVGAGGTGSSVAEQLVRLGVHDFVLVDADTFQASNITRVYGSEARDISGVPVSKVSIVKRNILRIAPGASVHEIEGTVVDQKAITFLSQCDAIFSCVDRQAPRSVLNEVAYQRFIPLIDVGAGLTTAEGSIKGGTVRATLVGPGLPCLYDYGIIRPDAIAAELLPEEALRRRRAEGYVPALDDPAPSVIAFTTMAASLGMTVFLDLLFGVLGDGVPNLLLELDPLRMSRLGARVGAECVCAMRMGKGDAIPISAP